MKDFVDQIKQSHSLLKEARQTGKKVDSYFILKDTLLTVYIESVSFLVSIVLVKYVLDMLEKKIEFTSMIPFFVVTTILVLFSVMAETYRENTLRVRHVQLLSKEVSKKYYKKLCNLPFSEQFNSETKDIAQFSFFYGAIIYYNADVILSTYIGYLMAFIINAGSVFIYGKWTGLIILAVFWIITLLLQKLKMRINDIEFKHSLVKNNLSRKTNYYRNSVFLNKQSNTVLKTYNARRFFIQQYAKTLDLFAQDEKQKNQECFWMSVLKNQGFSFLFHLVFFSCFIFEYAMYKTITLGTLWACYKSCMAVFGNNILNYLSDLQMTSRYIEQINKFFSLPDEQEIMGDKAIDPKDDINIIFDHVEFVYPGKRRKVLKDINITIHKGESIVLLGENGAGKTTILLLLYRLLKPTNGQILLNGINIEKYDLIQYRRMIHIMFQDHKLYPYPLATNIVLSNHYVNEKENIIAKAKETGLDKVINRLEKGIDTPLTRLFEPDGFVPSGGEVSKIGFTQQSINNNGIFVFDEYDSNIDPISEHDLNQRLLSMGETRIIISHRLSIAKDADKIYWIEGGRTVESGNHDELCKLNGKYAKMYEQRKNLIWEQ